MNNDYKNLTEWCDDYSKKSGVKIYPQSAPLQLVLEDVVGQINALKELSTNVFKMSNDLCHRIHLIEQALKANEKKSVKKEVKK